MRSTHSVCWVTRACRRWLLSAALLVPSVALLVTACVSSSNVTTSPIPAKCQIALAMTVNNMESSGGTGSLLVTTQPECTWKASTPADWITDLSPSSGQGSGEVTFRIVANPQSSPRQGDIVINDEHIRVAQTAAPCRFEIDRGSQDIAAAGGVTTVGLTAANACSWTATTSAGWMSVTPSTGSTSEAVTITVAPNTGGQRTGTVAIADQTFTVRQLGTNDGGATCTWSISPTSLSVQAAGVSGSTVSVTTGQGCAWTATSLAAWITITSGSSGNAGGSVTFNVSPNTGAARTGTSIIAGHQFSVTQAAATAPPACTFTIAPTSQSVAATGSTGTVAVTTTSGCAWTATSNAPWLTITSGANSTGSGSVGFSAQANTGTARTGTLTIAGATFTVTQAAPACTFTIAPTGQSVAASGGTGTVAVTAASGCAWTATSNAPWLTITSGANGTGSGSVGFSAQANTGTARTGTLTIAGATFTVSQAAAPACTFTIAPTSQSVAATGGTGTVAVTTTSACAWTATSNAPWLTITSGVNGTGNGSVGFSALANTGGARTGTLTIAGATFTVTQQAAPCVYVISPTAANFGAGGDNNFSIAVTTSSHCTWSATSNASWITINSGASGTGSGNVRIRVASNSGAATRTGTVTIAGQTFTATQQAK
ncbi:MAG TPA: BACON domain-containing carbohydrate-binding protein [Vicinamibacterales bacterium]|nr:BACON domain-containing carbohydrate-binding protein [Vicinamibacterales bacterium]